MKISKFQRIHTFSSLLNAATGFITAERVVGSVALHLIHISDHVCILEA